MDLRLYSNIDPFNVHNPYILATWRSGVSYYGGNGARRVLESTPKLVARQRGRTLFTVVPSLCDRCVPTNIYSRSIDGKEVCRSKVSIFRASDSLSTVLIPATEDVLSDLRECVAHAATSTELLESEYKDVTLAIEHAIFQNNLLPFSFPLMFDFPFYLLLLWM